MIKNLITLLKGSYLIWITPSKRILLLSMLPILTSMNTFILLSIQDNLLYLLLSFTFSLILALYWLAEMISKASLSYLAFTEIVLFISNLFLLFYCIMHPWIGGDIINILIWLLSTLSIISLSFPCSLFLIPPIVVEPESRVFDRLVITIKRLRRYHLTTDDLNPQTLLKLREDCKSVYALRGCMGKIDLVISTTILEWDQHLPPSKKRWSHIDDLLLDLKGFVDHTDVSEYDARKIGFDPLTFYRRSELVNGPDALLLAGCGASPDLSSWIDKTNFVEYDSEGYPIGIVAQRELIRFSMSYQNYHLVFGRFKMQMLHQHLLKRRISPFFKMDWPFCFSLPSFVKSCLNDPQFRRRVLLLQDIPTNWVVKPLGVGEYVNVVMDSKGQVTVYHGREMFSCVIKICKTDPDQVRFLYRNFLLNPFQTKVFDSVNDLELKIEFHRLSIIIDESDNKYNPLIRKTWPLAYHPCPVRMYIFEDKFPVNRITYLIPPREESGRFACNSH